MVSLQTHEPFFFNKFFKFSYANCSAQICTLFLKYLSFFFYWLFWADSFFVFSVTSQSCIIQRIKNFLCREIIFLNKTASIELCKTGDSVKTEKKTARDQMIHTMELMKRNLCRSKHKYELKLKIKGTKRSKHSRFKTNI